MEMSISFDVTSMNSALLLSLLYWVIKCCFTSKIFVIYEHIGRLARMSVLDTEVDS